MKKSSWFTKRFDEVFDLQMGKTPSRENQEYWGNDNCWVAISDIKGKYISETKECITDKAIVESKIKKVKAGTVIMSFKLTVGRTAIAKVDLYTNEAIMAFNLKSNYEVLPEYTYYYLKTYKWKGENKAVMGITLNKASISANKFVIPPLPEQSRIVEELDQLSNIIEKKRQQLTELDNFAQSIFYDMFGDPVTNEKGWEVKKLGEVCYDITDGDHMPPPKVTEGIPFITISNIDKLNRCVDFSNTFYVPEEYYNSIKENRKVRKGDVLYTVTGSYGIPIEIKESIKFCFQRHIGLLRPKEIVNSTYLCYWALMPEIKHQADEVATGIAQKTVSLGNLRCFKTIIPPLSLQQLFAQKIEAIEKEKELIKQSIKETEELFNSRMDYYFG